MFEVFGGRGDGVTDWRDGVCSSFGADITVRGFFCGVPILLRSKANAPADMGAFRFPSPGWGGGGGMPQWCGGGGMAVRLTMDKVSWSG